MNNPFFPDGEIPEEIRKRLQESLYINFKNSFFRATGPIPSVMPEDVTYNCNSGFATESVNGTALESDEVFEEINGVVRPITFKYVNYYDKNFVREYERVEAEENRRRFIQEIVGVAINPVTARKWLEPTYKIPEGESDGVLFNKPAIFRNYIAPDTLLLTFSKGSVFMIKIVEVIYG